DAGFTSNGFAALSCQGNLNEVRRALPGVGPATATWTFNNLPMGIYRISTTWSTASNRASNAPYTILNNTVALGTVRDNQQIPPIGFVDQNTGWSDLGNFMFAGGSLTVRLSNDAANGWVIADAVRVELVVPIDHIDVPAPAL